MVGIRTWVGWIQEKIKKEQLERAPVKHSPPRWLFSVLLENVLHHVFHIFGPEFFLSLTPSCHSSVH